MKNIGKKNAGFTLMELMIVVAIIGILAAIAYPNYLQYLKNVNRKAAVAELLDIKDRLERHYTVNNGTYTGFTYTANPNIRGYTIAAPTIEGNGQSYTITAALDSTDDGDPDCGDLTVTSTGGESSTKGSGCFR